MLFLHEKCNHSIIINDNDIVVICDIKIYTYTKEMRKYYITQIYFTENDARNDELKHVIELHKTSEFDKVYYLNEKIYGYDCEKIKEVNIGKRLLFNDVFDFVKSEELEGVIFFGNSDIYFNKTIHNVLDVISEIPIMYCQLRVENKANGSISIDTKSRMYKEGHSQDVWIYHSNFNDKLINTMEFNFGILGCDNVCNNIAHSNGFKLINNPFMIHCIHLHNIEFRVWKKNKIPRLKLPYTNVLPISYSNKHKAVSSKLAHYVPQFDD